MKKSVYRELYGEQPEITVYKPEVKETKPEPKRRGRKKNG